MDERYGVTLSDAYAEAAASAPAERVVLYTYELEHPAFTERILIVNDYADLRANLETGELVTFVACPVSVVAPEESDNAASPSIQVQIQGVSSLVAGRLDAAMQDGGQIHIVERVYCSDQLDAPAITPPLKLVLRDVEVNETTVTAQAGYDDPINRGFPGKDYTIREYPGLSAR